MANTPYENYFLSNEVEDQFNSHLDLTQFCTVDKSLEGTAGMKRVVNVYSATNGTEKLAQGEGNSKSITVGHTSKEYEILLAQNRFEYFDEEAMKDPNLVPVGMKHAGTDLYNTVNDDIYAEFKKATLSTDGLDGCKFDAFVDSQSLLGIENLEDMQMFGFVHPNDMGKVRKALKDDLKYVEAFAKNGYVGTVAGINLYTKKDAKDGTIYVGTKDAVTLFIKTGIETEQERDADTRKNLIYSRKYYFAALTDATKVVAIPTNNV
jgi:hypothetical protein